jgi:hypothetical protein
MLNSIDAPSGIFNFQFSIKLNHDSKDLSKYGANILSIIIYKSDFYCTFAQQMNLATVSHIEETDSVSGRRNDIRTIFARARIVSISARIINAELLKNPDLSLTN